MRKWFGAISRVDKEVWLLLGLSAFAWLPLLAPGYFLNAHDAPHTVFFLRQFDQAIQDGFLIPRWGTDFALGYGYPLFLFYSPLAYYVAEIFLVLGAGLTLALKLTYVVAFIGSGLAMYVLGRRLFGRSAGLLAGLLYVYMPYHLVDVYVRCDLTESLAYVFLPLTVWAFGKLVESGGRRNIAWAATSYAGLILAHNGTALVFTPFLIVYILFLLFKVWRVEGWAATANRALQTFAGAALGCGLSAFFLVPALLEQKFIVQEQWIQGSFSYLKHFVFPGQLFSPLWGFGYAGEGLADDMSFQLGLIPVIFSVLAVTLGWNVSRRRGDRNFLILASAVVIFFMLPTSAALWEAVPMAALVQFPWRLLIVTSVSLALLGGNAGNPHGPLRRRPLEYSGVHTEPDRRPGQLLVHLARVHRALATLRGTGGRNRLRAGIPSRSHRHDGLDAGTAHDYAAGATVSGWRAAGESPRPGGRRHSGDDPTRRIL